MPNWCYNHLEVTGPSDVVAEFQSATTNEDGHLSFDCLVPMPEQLRKPDGGDGWYSWSVDNWGTKWDVDGSNVGTMHVPLDNGLSRLTYDFNTAWAPPTGWLERVSPQFRQLKFAIWYDEPGADFCGLEIFEMGALDIAASWSGPSVSSVMCSVRGCEEYTEAKAITQFTRAPKPEELESYCEDHQLVKAVVSAIREAGEEVSLVTE